MNWRKFSSAGLMAAVLTACGCGGGASEAPPLGQVTGTVKVDGNPIEGAEIQFIPEGGGRPSTATTDSEGKYTLAWSAEMQGAAVGKHTVSIRTERAGHSPEGEGAGPAVEARLELLPPEYNTESTLTKEVTSGTNEINFDLETKGFKPGTSGSRPRNDP